MLRTLLGLGVSLLGALGVSAAHAQVYKCVDASGKTVYSQSPCPSGTSSRILSRKPAPSTDDAASKPASKSAVDQEMEFRKRQKEREEAEKKAGEQTAEAKRRQEECARARGEVAQYDMGGRLSRINEKGERYFLDDDQVARERSRAQASVDQLCK